MPHHEVPVVQLLTLALSFGAPRGVRRAAASKTKGVDDIPDRTLPPDPAPAEAALSASIRHRRERH